MRRRLWLVGVILAVVVIAFVIVRHRSSTRSSSRAEHTASDRSTRAGALAPDSDVRARKVAGTVYLDGELAGAASVRLVAFGGTTLASRRTDAAGHFALGDVPMGTYRVIAEVDGATGATIGVDLRDPTVEADKLRLVAHACEASVRGVIRDASGGVIEKARIAVSDMTTLELGPGIDSADDGSYELCVPVGDSVLIARAEGYADGFVPLSAFGRVHRDFALVPEAIVAGRAVRQADGAPVANAQLTLEAEDYRVLQGLPTLHAVSDDDGRFRFRGVAAGHFTLSAVADHLATTDPVSIDAEIAAPREDVECRLAATLSIAGRVIDKQHKKPLGGVWLYARLGAGERFESTTSRPDGSFLIEQLAPGDYQIRTRDLPPTADGVHVKLDTHDVDDVTVETDGLASIAGRVTRGGKPVDGAQVQIYRQGSGVDERREVSQDYATSDADGTFVVRALAAGSYRLYAESKRVGAFTQGPTVAVAASEEKTGIDIEMNLAGSIAGTVVDQAGAPVAGVSLRFSLLQGQDFGEATTADDGTFKARALAGGGDYIYEVRPQASSPIKFRPASGSQFPPVAVRDGDTQVTGVVIKIRFERLAISGRVISNDGSGVPDAVVSTLRRGRTGFMGREEFMAPSGTTDQSGAFTIKDLPAGQYIVVARSPRGSARLEDVTAGARGLELRLPAVGTIVGTLEGFAQPPTVFAYSGAGRRLGTVNDTTFTIENIPVGECEVTARGKDGNASARVTVDAKHPTHVLLRNPGIGSVEGRVIDETTHQPVADLMCMMDVQGAFRTSPSTGFHFDRVAAGSAEVACDGGDFEAQANITVERGKTTHVELVAKKRVRSKPGYSGLAFESRLSDVVVKQVAAGSPGERAGVKVGDFVRVINGEEIDLTDEPWNQPSIDFEPAGTIITLTLERDGKRRDVEIKLEAPP